MFSAIEWANRLRVAAGYFAGILTEVIAQEILT